MLATAASAVYAGIVLPYRPAIVEGALVFDWVIGAWLTVRRSEGQVGFPEYAVLVLGLLGVATAVIVGFEAASRENGLLDEIPAIVCFAFAGFAALSVAFDLKMILQKGVFGAKRIVRHLSRVTGAWVVAAVGAISPP